ncbi:GntR family transcriptional regulator [Microbacterium sp. gxy059]|uniref:GntR family transcriptional regulator n=1 Tax=Microbacterium sp. gxy059 TaxID=2957199 RepID=UPI003D964145
MGIRRQVLREEVEELILQRLLESRWEPGARLSIDGLARDLEVSPTPVREALVSLERSGLVEYAALRGYVVASPLDREHMAELLEARRIVETAALSKAFDDWEALSAALEAAHRQHTEVLERIAAQGEQEMDFSLMNEHYQADWAFHQAFFDHAGNRYLRGMVENLRIYTHRMRQTWTGGPASFDARTAYEEHARILEKVRHHHYDGALKALEAHLSGVLERSLAEAPQPE